MDKEIDHGPIVTQFKEKIRPDDTNETLTKRLFLKTAPVLMSLMGHMGLMKPLPQNHSLATFTKLLTKNDGFLNLVPQNNAMRDYNFIRAMSPWPGAWSNVILNEVKDPTRDSSASGLRMTVKRLKILRAHLENEKLVLDEVQLEGKKPVSWNEFQKAYPEAEFSSLTS